MDTVSQRRDSLPPSLDDGALRPLFEQVSGPNANRQKRWPAAARVKLQWQHRQLSAGKPKTVTKRFKNGLPAKLESDHI